MRYGPAILLLVFGMAVFGSGTPVSKLVTDVFPPLVGSMLRMGFAALVLLPFVIWDWSAVRALARRDWYAIGGITLIGMIAFSVFMLYGMKEVSGVVGSIVMSTTPAVTAFAAYLFLRESLDWRKVTAIVLAVAGVLVIHLGGLSDDASGSGNIVLGSVLVFGAVCSEALYTLLGRVATQRIHPLTVAGLAALAAFILFIPLALLQLGQFTFADVGPGDWVAIMWWGVGTMAIGSGLWYSGVQKVPGSVAAGFMGVMPVSALVLSYVLLGEPFRWIHIAGFSLVFAGVLLISWSHAKMTTKGSE